MPWGKKIAGFPLADCFENRLIVGKHVLLGTLVAFGGKIPLPLRAPMLQEQRASSEFHTEGGGGGGGGGLGSPPPPPPPSSISPPPPGF